MSFHNLVFYSYNLFMYYFLFCFYVFFAHSQLQLLSKYLTLQFISCLLLFFVHVLCSFINAKFYFSNFYDVFLCGCCLSLLFTTPRSQNKANIVLFILIVNRITISISLFSFNNKNCLNFIT